MKTITLKTNIMCADCIEKVTPKLDELVGADHWSVDTQSPDKKLTVSIANDVNGSDVIAAVQAAGYKADPVS